MVLAARGTRKDNGKEEKVVDEALAATLRGKGQGIWLKTIGLAAVVTAVIYFI